MKALDDLAQRFRIVHIEKWLPEADERDVVGELELARIYQADFDIPVSGEKLREAISAFAGLTEIHSAAPQAINRINGAGGMYIPNDPYLNRQWYLDNIMVKKAWGLWGDKTPGDSVVVVGVVDTGVDIYHPDLADAIWVNPGEDIDGDGMITEADRNNVDDDGDGYIDDFHGWDFADGDNDVYPPDAGPHLDLSHGTHVAGVIGAVADDSVGIAGVSFRARIMVTKHAKDSELTDPNLTTGYKGLDYCARRGAQIINCSWGGGYDFYGEVVVNNAVNNYGAVIVCAAGNDGHDSDVNKQYPSGYEKTLSIAALRKDDKKAYYSNFGTSVDLSAPGGEGGNYSNAIYSTIHSNAGSYTAWQGTSMASPVAAGAFALLKAWFPDKSRSWLINTMKNTADDIDEINPSYAGKLGSGRVNVYNAIGRSIFPDLSLSNYEIQIVGADQRSAVRPGDHLKLTVSLSNSEGWQEAADVKVQLLNNSADISLEDSLSRFNSVSPGEVVSNDTDELLFSVSEQALFRPLEMELKITANDTAENPYERSETISFNVSAEQAGFPAEIPFSTPPAIARFAGYLPQIISVSGSELYALNGEGTVSEGFPVEVGSTSAAPVVADINADGKAEIVIVNRKGNVQIFERNGTLIKTISTADAVYGDVAVANLDDDPDLEIIFGTMRRTLHAVKMDSSELDSFPIATSSMVNKGVAVGDLNGDRIPEMIFATYDNKINVVQANGDTLAPFPVATDDKIEFTPLVVTLATDTAVILVSKSNAVFILNKDGSQRGRYEAQAKVKTQPALCDWNADGVPEIFFGTDDGKLHAIDLDAQILQTFPWVFDNAVLTSPVFADFDKDGLPEIVFSTTPGNLYVMDHNGDILPNFPAALGETPDKAMALANLDADENEELVVSGSSFTHVLEFDEQADNFGYWRTYLGNNRRTGNYNDIMTSIAEFPAEIIPGQFILRQNYPNPFNPQTMIVFEVPEKMQGRVLRLDVFNVLGERVARLFEGKAQAKSYALEWRGKNSAGKQLPSGIYFYRLSAKDVSLTKRMLLIK